MLNPHLTNVVIASLRDAGITPPELSTIRPFPQPRASIEELTEVLIASEYEDPYEDPKAIAHAAKLYIQSLGRLDQGHYQRERERQAAALEAHTETILAQLQKAFDTTAKKLIKDAEPVNGVEDLTELDAGTLPRDSAIAAVNTMQNLTALERIVKAWRDLWLALGNNSYGVERGKPFTYMTPNAEQWNRLRNNPTIWEAVRAGVPLALAERPEQVSARFQAMLIDAEPKERERESLLPAGGYPQWV